MKQSKNSLLLIIISGSFFFSCIQNEKENNKMESLQSKQTKGLEITPSAASSPNDFNFLEGKWKVHNRKLKTRLKNSHDWSEFESTLHMRKVLNGTGNVENYYAVFDGKPFEGMAVRLFNSKTKLWTIYWIDTSGVIMDEHPVTGSFDKGVGKFYAEDVYESTDIIVLYQWDATDPDKPEWNQAFSADNGKTWEWNWKMILTPIK